MGPTEPQDATLSTTGAMYVLSRANQILEQRLEQRERLLEKCRVAIEAVKRHTPETALILAPATHEGLNCTLAFVIDVLLAEIEAANV